MGAAARKKKTIQELGFNPLNIQPMHDRVLVRRIEYYTTRSLIVIPDIAVKESTRCVVVVVGPGKWRFPKDGPKFREPMQVEPGDVVLIGPYKDWEDLSEGFVLIQQADIRIKEKFRIEQYS
jgi:co-chaperonin GroES (HSP10)